MYLIDHLHSMLTRAAPLDERLVRLKAAVEAGYYRTEPALDKQTTFPWQNRVCRDCPYWQDEYCIVHAEFRAPTSPTCREDDVWRDTRAVKHSLS